MRIVILILILITGVVTAFLVHRSFVSVEFEPMPVYTSERVFNVGGVPERKIEERFGVVPWKRRASEKQTPPVGYIETIEKDKVLWQGKMVDCQKRKWVLNPENKLPNHRFQTAEIWCLEGSGVPAFVIPVMNAWDFPVPAGCIKLAVWPKVFGATERNSLRIDGELLGESVCTIGQRNWRVQEFYTTISLDDNSARMNFKLSGDIDGAVLSISREGNSSAGSVVSRIIDIGTLPVPNDIQIFKDAGFGFSPSAGYAEYTINPGQLTRWGNGPDSIFAVSIVDAKNQNFDTWWKIKSDELFQQADCVVFDDGYSTFPILCVPTKGYVNEKLHIAVFYFERNGVIYCIEIQGGDKMKTSEMRKLLDGWRWIKKPN